MDKPKRVCEVWVHGFEQTSSMPIRIHDFQKTESAGYLQEGKFSLISFNGAKETLTVPTGNIICYMITDDPKGDGKGEDKS